MTFPFNMRTFLLTRKKTEENMQYRIRVAGQINAHWSHWFEGMTIDYDGSTTTLTGSVVDQSQLHGILHRIRDLNLTLISLNQLKDRNKNKPNREGR